MLSQLLSPSFAKRLWGSRLSCSRIKTALCHRRRAFLAWQCNRLLATVSIMPIPTAWQWVKVGQEWASKLKWLKLRCRGGKQSVTVHFLTSGDS